MSVSNQIQDRRLRTTIPFEGDERDEFRALVKENGYKVGAYIRLLIVRDMAAKKISKAVGRSPKRASE